VRGPLWLPVVPSGWGAPLGPYALAPLSYLTLPAMNDGRFPAPIR